MSLKNSISFLFLQVKENNRFSRCRYDWVKDGMSATVNINYLHNHPVCNAEALSLRRVDPETRSTFLKYFDDGLSAAAASEFHCNQLDMDPDVNAVVLRADAATNPSRKAVSYMYSQWREANLGNRHGEGMLEMLEKKLDVYRGEGICITVERDPFTVAIVTPLMQRAHTLKSAADVVFIDSTASCDADNHVITFLLVTSPHGAVPAGVIISSGQSQRDYVAAFSALNVLLNGRGFGGQGHPTVIITDDSAAEKSALNTVWPLAVQKLCHFHVMQAVWRWLWDPKHVIEKDDRKDLMQGFRRVLYACEECETEELYSSLLEQAESFENFQGYVESLWDRKESWGMAWRNIASLRGHHTNNFAEITVRLFKDNILTRCKAYNAVALVDFIVSVMERFYRNRLERYANGRETMYSLLLEKLLRSCEYIVSKDSIQQIQASDGAVMYHVPSESMPGLLYEVDPICGVCSCPSGMDGYCCKHQISVFKWFEEMLPNMPPVSAQSRYEAAWLALGDTVPPKSFYESLKASSVNKQCVESSLSLSFVQQTRDVEPVMACQPIDDTSDSDELLLMWSNISADIERLIGNPRVGSNKAELKAGLEKLQQRVGNIHNGSQLSSLFNSFGQSVPRRCRAGAMIRTQPTAAARRKQPGITRGAKRQLGGRPAAGVRPAAKRPRNLAFNIDANVPNAKSHGQNH